MSRENESISWVWKTKFLKHSIIGGIMCATIIFFLTTPLVIKPLYESEAIVYVPLTILSQQINQHGVGFADDKEIDAYIQTLKSNSLKDSLVKRFSLAKHYNINENNVNMISKAGSILRSRVSAEKTRYGSVSIKVRDTNPQIAADMTNAIIDLGEIVKKEFLYPNRFETMLYMKSLFEQKTLQVAVLEKQLDSLVEAKRDGNDINNFIYQKTFNLYNLELKELFSRKELYEREQKNFDTPLPRVYVISKAAVNPDPVWPKRGLLVGIGVGLFMFLLITIEIIKRDHST